MSTSEAVWNNPTGNYLKFSYLLYFINASLYRRRVRVFARSRAARKYAKKNLTMLYQWNKLFSFDVSTVINVAYQSFNMQKRSSLTLTDFNQLTASGHFYSIFPVSVGSY